MVHFFISTFVPTYISFPPEWILDVQFHIWMTSQAKGYVLCCIENLHKVRTLCNCLLEIYAQFQLRKYLKKYSCSRGSSWSR
jgi:hypothetical protein